MRTAPKRTRNQHFIPRLYLRAFTTNAPANTIWTYDTERHRWRNGSVESTAFQSNFYSVKQDDGTYFDDLDNWLTGVEAAAAPQYKRLLHGELPQEQAKMDLAVFFAALHCRSPAFIRQHAHARAQMMEVVSNLTLRSRDAFNDHLDAYEAARGPMDISRDELWEFQRDPSRYYLSVSEKAGLRSMAVVDELTPILFSRHWTLIAAAEGYFITSDNPVCRFVPPEDHHRVYGDGGFLNRKAEVTVPLSPSLGLLISEHDTGGAVVPLPKLHVDQMNGQRAFNSERHLYSHERSEETAALGDEFASDKPRFVISGVGKLDIEIRR